MAQVWVAGVPASSLGYVSDVEWSSVWAEGPSGCQEASFTIAAGPRHQIRQLARGADVQLRVGPATFWRGQVITSERVDSGLRVTAHGIARFANDYGALSGGTSSTMVQTAATEAIGRGWRAVAGAFPSWAGTRLTSTDPLALVSLQTLLTEGCNLNAVKWTVWEDRILRFESDPTAVRWVTRPTSGALGLADEDYYTHITVLYLSTSNARLTETRGNDALAAKYGRREKLVDFTGLGQATSATAGFWASSRLALSLPRIGWNEALEVELAALTTLNGIPAHPAQIRAGQRVRLDGVMEDQGAVNASLSTVITLGEVKYADGSPTITLSPVGLPARDLSAVVADVASETESVA